MREDKRRPTDLSEEQLAWILSRETIIMQVGMTIAERRAQFLRRWPDRQISESKYWSLYRKHHVRKKKIRITKINDANRERRIRRETEFMAQQLKVMTQRGFRIVYLDETMVTTKTIPTHEWSGVKHQIQVDQQHYGRKAIAVLAGVSQERGVDLMMQFEKSVNIEKFKVWLDELRARHFHDDICLVLDNLSVHRSHAAIDRIDELGFEYVFTPAYCPDANPIESVFSMFKARLRKERIACILHEKTYLIPQAIERIWLHIEAQKIKNCIIHVLKFLNI